MEPGGWGVLFQMGEGLGGERRCQAECWQAPGPGVTWEATGVVVAMAEMG